MGILIIAILIGVAGLCTLFSKDRSLYDIRYLRSILLAISIIWTLFLSIVYFVCKRESDVTKFTYQYVESTILNEQGRNRSISSQLNTNYISKDLNKIIINNKVWSESIWVGMFYSKEIASLKYLKIE